MSHSPTRPASLLVPITVAAAVAVACGQVTGLSDDYVFDLVDAGDSSADASKGDAAGDALADVTDAARKCTVAASAAALQQLNQGSTLCKTCLAQSCCTDVDSCTRNQECNRTLDCKLDCTTKNTSERAQCSKGCNSGGGGPTALYSSGIGACAASACTQECGF